MSGNLYHADVYLPERLRRPLFQGRLKYQEHAIEASKDDRYGSFDLPEFFEAANARLIEVEFDEDRKCMTKQVWRQPLDAYRDLVLVIGLAGFVKTVWVNLRSDKHSTLDASKYVRA